MSATPTPGKIDIEEDDWAKDANGNFLDHYICDCDPDRGFCGTPTVPGEGFWEDPDDNPIACVVCDDIFNSIKACPFCGKTKW